ncbi:DNA helicase [Oscillospiraceae bacterium]|nr:DNA helicase [Oscillospiraceae bacterium]BDF74357.1 DNA helicase [Oscillospiraceae bacterium]
MLIADLHIHSKYSRATSRDCVPEQLDLWARRKGIGLVGTGDFTHPAWRAELAEKLAPAGEGVYALREELRLQDGTALDSEHTRFVVTGEISSIYKKDGKVRKVHSLILLPSLAAAENLSRRLEAIGNIHSDGRPILGLDCRDLLEITLEASPQAVFIPAHIWTPHFSLFGAFSGFDAIGDCFGDLTPHIHALETGLSSDPPMNWRLSALDGYHLVSNSDAHSPSKLGREANLLDIAPDYPSLAAALQTGKGLAGTIEFFPEEGKYHFDGHRNCHICLSPGEAEAVHGKCPVCGKRLTTGVLHRVEQLADRPEGYRRPDAVPFECLAPLPEVIAASAGGSASGVKTQARYEAMLAQLGSEFYILRQAPLEDVGRVAGPCVAEGLRRLRAGQVERRPGYDGEFGVIGLLDPAEREALNGQVSMFGAQARAQKKKAPRRAPSARKAEPRPAAQAGAISFNAGQRAAIEAAGRAVAVIAGPGTGKTGTLAERAAWLVRERGARPGQITAVTFTNKAAGELRARLAAALGRRAANCVHVGTFHALCLELLEKYGGGARLVGDYEALFLAGAVLKERGLKTPARRLLQEVSRRKSGQAPRSEELEGACAAYNGRLRALGALDYDDLLLEGLALWEAGGMKKAAGRFTHLLVDEFQDCNAVQYALVRAWAGAGESLFAIGDPDQSVYGFRGADPACFGRLGEDFPALETVRLTKNYRSTPEILSCALPIPGPGRVLEAVPPSGAAVRVLTAESPMAEAVFIAKEVNRMVGGVDMLDAADGRFQREEAPRGFSDVAVCYRTRRQADLVEHCLRREGIPCVVAGRDDFLSDPTVRGACCFFRLLLEPEDPLALGGCLRLLWSCPADLLDSVGAFWAAAPGGAAERAQAVAAQYAGVGVLRPWLELVEAFSPRTGEEPAGVLSDWAGQAGCAGSEALERLINTAVFHKTLAALLDTLALGQEGDLLRSAGRGYEAGAVRLTTFHAAKGLEFPVVFLCGVRRGVVPLEAEGVDAAEERRLLYVGMTRAREELIILTGPEPSPFLADLPEACVARGSAAPLRKPRPAEQLSLF